MDLASLNQPAFKISSLSDQLEINSPSRLCFSPLCLITTELPTRVPVMWFTGCSNGPDCTTVRVQNW